MDVKLSCFKLGHFKPSRFKLSAFLLLSGLSGCLRGLRGLREFIRSLLLSASCLQLIFMYTAFTYASSIIASSTASADPVDAEFYHQLLKIPQTTGYQPTRNFTIVIDTDHGNQLIADDDATLRFNQLWLEQFQPGHQDRRGGAAFGEMFRSFFKQVYRNYRDSHAQDLSGYPDENGSIRHNSYSTSMDYNVKVTDDEVRFKVQYSF